MKVLSDIDVSGKRVFVRADLDVPLNVNSESKIVNGSEQATRLTNLKPTAEYLLAHGAKQIIIAGHIDRPSFTKASEGKPPGYDPKLSTEQLLEPLQKILGRGIAFQPNVILGSPSNTLRINSTTPESDSGQALRLRSGQARMTGDRKITLLENLRFWPGETANDVEFAKQLASLADVYVNEAFGNSHRNHASMVALPKLFANVEDPDGVHSRRAVGLHLAKEIEVLSRLLTAPERPFVAIVGGAKIETKVPVIENLAKIADQVLVGGEIAKEMRSFASEKQNPKIKIAQLTENEKDVATSSIVQTIELIKQAKTIVWNGPMGVFEEGYDEGTLSVAQAIIESQAFSVVGGGETTQFLASKNLLSKFSFVSSGGGAMLEFLSGRQLIAIRVLE